MCPSFTPKEKGHAHVRLLPIFPNATVTAALTHMLLAYARPGFAVRSLSFWECTRVQRDSGLPAALSEIDKVPGRVPVVVGVNVTLIVQLLPAVTEPPQLLLSAKSPLVAIPEITRLAVPVFVSITGCVALVVPTV